MQAANQPMGPRISLRFVALSPPPASFTHYTHRDFKAPCVHLRLCPSPPIRLSYTLNTRLVSPFSPTHLSYTLNTLLYSHTLIGKPVRAFESVSILHLDPHRNELAITSLAPLELFEALPAVWYDGLAEIRAPSAWSAVAISEHSLSAYFRKKRRSSKISSY